MRVNAGADRQALQMAGGTTTSAGTSTAVTATSLTDTAKAWTTNAFAGLVVATGGVWGIIQSNTATVLTVDRWYTPASPGGAAAATPATGSYVIAPGGAPCAAIALSTSATAPAATDTTLAGELNNAGGGLNRALATYSHTAGTSSYTLSTTFTANASDPASSTINKCAVFDSVVPVTGTMMFEDAVPSPPTAVSGDTFTPTFTISY